MSHQPDIIPGHTLLQYVEDARRKGWKEAFNFMRDRSEALRGLIERQAEDEGLWYNAETAAEAYVQCALREAHAAVEETIDCPHVSIIDEHRLEADAPSLDDATLPSQAST